MPLTLEEAIARVPRWAGAEDLRATPLSGGITNCNYRIDVGEEAFVLRIAGTDTALLGINREYEYAANLAAGRLGVAPEVYYFIRPEGYLVTRFMPGRPILPDEMRQPENIRRVMDTLRKVHSMADIPGAFNAFGTIQKYADTAHQYQVVFPQNYDLLNVHVQEAEKALLAHADRSCPCHNDLLNGNFITNGRLTLLDWEYAGMGDLFFDLANFSDHHDLTNEQDRWLLEDYFNEEATPEHWAHLKIMKIISDLREATWGLVQVGISTLDFDFREYADRFFGRVFDNIQKSQWNEWLKEVSKNV
jgi:thiamine kinase-like enzyme